MTHLGCHYTLDAILVGIEAIEYSWCLHKGAAREGISAAGIQLGVVLRVDAQAVEGVGVGTVVGELAQGRELGAHCGGGGGTLWVIKHTVPKTISLGTCIGVKKQEQGGSNHLSDTGSHFEAGTSISVMQQCFSKNDTVAEHGSRSRHITCCNVVADGVVGVCDPEGGRGGVGDEQCIRGASQDDQVALNDVPCLNTILQEESVA